MMRGVRSVQKTDKEVQLFFQFRGEFHPLIEQ